MQEVNSSQVFYSSMVVLPLRGIPSSGATKVTVQTAYLQTQCIPSFVDLNVTDIEYMNKIGVVDAYMNFTAQQNQSFGTLVYASSLPRSDSIATGMMCALFQVPLDVMLSCLGPENCTVDQARSTSISQNVPSKAGPDLV